jgi:hypothetical protein
MLINLERMSRYISVPAVSNVFFASPSQLHGLISPVFCGSQWYSESPFHLPIAFACHGYFKGPDPVTGVCPITVMALTSFETHHLPMGVDGGSPCSFGMNLSPGA